MQRFELRARQWCRARTRSRLGSQSYFRRGSRRWSSCRCRRRARSRGGGRARRSCRSWRRAELASEFLIAGRANQKITLRAESTDDIKTSAQDRAVHARALFEHVRQCNPPAATRVNRGRRNVHEVDAAHQSTSHDDSVAVNCRRLAPARVWKGRHGKSFLGLRVVTIDRICCDSWCHHSARDIDQTIQCPGRCETGRLR